MPVHAVRLRLRRRALLIPAELRAVQPEHREFLLLRSDPRSRVPPQPVRRVQGPEAGESTSGSGRAPQDNRLRIRKEAHGQNVDSLRHSGVPGAGDYPVQGP